MTSFMERLSFIVCSSYNKPCVKALNINELMNDKKQWSGKDEKKTN